MAQRFDWTPARNRQVLELRRSGATWDTVAAAIGVGRNSVIDHARRLGVRKRSSVGAPPPPVREATDRPARPSGHPDTWGLITAGTVLEGSPYPWPVFDL